MAAADPNSWEEALITEMREQDGPPASGPLAGHPILVMHVTGAKSGEPRRAILTYSRDGDAYVVAGTAGGSRRDPSWLANVRVNPDVTFEIGRRRFKATASVADEAERQRLWDQHVAQLPWFAAYPDQTGREIPMVKLIATPA
jgi:deazaflavin-dependent oxidoreductase (nitroreductase family)